MSSKINLLIQLILLFLISASITYGQVTVMAAAGGNDLDNYKAVNGSAPAYTTLGDIVIRENSVDDIKEDQKNKKLILTAPSNWQFNTDAGNVIVSLGDDIKKISLKVNDLSLEVKFTTDKKNKGKDSIDEITISGIQVQPIDGTLIPSAGNIFRTSEDPGNAEIFGITEAVTNFGSLSMQLSAENPPINGGVIVTAGTGGTNLIRGTAENGSHPEYTTLGDIIILETAVDDIKDSQKNKKLILTPPDNWQFNPSSGSVIATRGDDITKISVKVNKFKIEIKFTTDKKKKGKDSIDEITISEIQVQPIVAAVSPAAGNILSKSTDPGNAQIKGITEDITNFGSLSTDPDSPMPVELTSFTSDIYGRNVSLYWATATEVNNYGFEIQRSAMSDQWDVIGFVEGHGNSYSPKNYEFTDDLSTLEVHSQTDSLKYRLKQIDLDGQYEYYGLTTAVDFSTLTNTGEELFPGEFKLYQNYPNPFNPSTTIAFEIPESGDTKLEVYDSIGQQVATLIKNELAAGRHQVEWNASGLASGFYLYKITTRNYAEVKKMLLLR